MKLREFSKPRTGDIVGSVRAEVDVVLSQHSLKMGRVYTGKDCRATK